MKIQNQDGKINKIFEKACNKAGFEIELYLDENNLQLLEVYENGEDCEPLFMLSTNGESASYYGNLYLDKAIKEELPAFYKDGKAVIIMLEFVSKGMQK